MVGPLVEGRPYRAEVPGGGELAVDEKKNGVGDSFDLLEDVRRDHDGAPLAREPPQEPLKVEALPRIRAVQRFVQKEDLRVVDQHPGEADSLAHSPGIGADLPVGGIVELHMPDSALHGLVEGSHLSKLSHQSHELTPRHESVHGFVLEHDPEPPGEKRVVANGLSEDGDRAARDPGEPRDHANQGALSRSVRTEQPRDAGADVQGDVVDGHDVSEPARKLLGPDHRRGCGGGQRVSLR